MNEYVVHQLWCQRLVIGIQEMDEDSTLVSDEQVVENLVYTSRGSLVLSDWVGDPIEAYLPDAITFARESACEEPPC